MRGEPKGLELRTAFRPPTVFPVPPFRRRRFQFAHRDQNPWYYWIPWPENLSLGGYFLLLGDFLSMAVMRWTKRGRAGRAGVEYSALSLLSRFFCKAKSSVAHPPPPPQELPSWPNAASYSIMEGSLVSRIWSVRIQGIDISMGNWIRRPMVNSRKNSRNQSWERSQHC